MDELSRIHELEKEGAKLKVLIVKKDLDKVVLDSYLEVAAKKMGIKNAKECLNLSMRRSHFRKNN